MCCLGQRTVAECHQKWTERHLSINDQYHDTKLSLTTGPWLHQRIVSKNSGYGKKTKAAHFSWCRNDRCTIIIAYKTTLACQRSLWEDTWCVIEVNWQYVRMFWFVSWSVLTVGAASGHEGIRPFECLLQISKAFDIVSGRFSVTSLFYFYYIFGLGLVFCVARASGRWFQARILSSVWQGISFRPSSPPYTPTPTPRPTDPFPGEVSVLLSTSRKADVLPEDSEGQIDSLWLHGNSTSLALFSAVLVIPACQPTGDHVASATANHFCEIKVGFLADDRSCGTAERGCRI